MMQSRLIPLSISPTIDPISSICNPNVHLDHFQFRKSTITCARSSNKGFLRSQRSNKTLVRLVRFAASNLHYVLPLPAPFDSVIREFGDGGYGGGGGSGGYWKGFGWGGFDGGGGGRKRRVNKKSNLWFWGFVAVCCLGFWCLSLNLGKLEVKTEVVLGAICLSMFLVLIWNGCVPEWVLGFCSGGFIVGLSFEKKGELQKFLRGFKAMGVSRRQRGRRAF